MLSRDMPKKIIDQWNQAYLDTQKTDFFEKGVKKWSAILEMDMGFLLKKGILSNNMHGANPDPDGLFQPQEHQRPASATQMV